MTEEQTDGFTWELIKPLYGEIFSQLIEMPHFIEWFATNCDIDIHMDEEEERILVQVNPVSLQETAKRVLALQKAKAEEGPLIVEPPKDLIL